MALAASPKTQLSLSDGITLACLVLVYYLVKVTVLPGDSLLAWPITDSIMHPAHYSSNDLIVKAGVEGNFLLYRLLALVPFLQDNLPLRDFLIYIPLFYLYLVAWWHVYAELGASRHIATTATALLLFSDNKLGLNWSLSPFPNLLSASSVLFIQVFGLYLFLSKRRALALGLTAATGYLHPATALSFGAVFSAIICLDAYKQKKLKILVPIILFVALFLPNAFVIMHNSQGAFAVNDQYYRIFELFSYHTYLGTHFRMGYAYTLVLIIFLYRFFRQGVPGLRHRNELFLFIGLGIAGSIAWLTNLYITKNLQILHVFFIIRIFYLIKPLLIFLIVLSTVQTYRSARSIADHCIALLLLMTPFYFSPSVALIIVSGCAVSVAGKRWWPFLCGFLLLIFFLLVTVTQHASFTEALLYFRADMGGNEFNIFQVIVMVATSLFIITSMHYDIQHANFAHLSRKEVLFVLLVLFFSLSIPANISRTIRKSLRGQPNLNFRPEEYWGIRPADPDYGALLDWARSSTLKFFVIPPYDDRFMNFRYLTGKGVYGQQWDIPQLAYSPKYYYSGYERLIQLGLDPSNRMQFRWNWNYEARCQTLIANVPADVIIFEKQRLKTADCSNMRPLFENGTFIAYRTAGRPEPGGLTKPY